MYAVAVLLLRISAWDLAGCACQVPALCRVACCRLNGQSAMLRVAGER